MSSPSVLFRGAGWRLPDPLDLRDAREVREVAADDPDGIPGLLDWLDAVAASGRPGRIAAGYLTYEAGVALEGSASLFRPPSTPLAWFGLFEMDEAAGPGTSAQGAADSIGHERVGDPRARRRPDEAGDAAGIAGAALPPSSSDRSGTGERGEMSLVGWTAGVEAIRDGIARGDVYQANLTRRVVKELAITPRRLAELLWRDNPVPYAILVDAGADAVVSNSPELFLDVDLRSRRVASAPIKGTVPLRQGGSEASARAALLASEKDAAEHLMIVDLIRNDLGRACEAGSVHVPDFRAVKSFRHLHHLESTVAGTLRPEVRLSELLSATLPGGSITGAPKRAALGFIRRLEPVPRGPYTGAAGYVRGDGTAVFNVAIRTAVVGPGRVAYHAGGGIVWDSDPLLEWEETETKSREFFRALAMAASESEVP